eukprot:scaffold198102_cov17-Tisochrysis_lutea.AAC.1
MSTDTKIRCGQIVAERCVEGVGLVQLKPCRPTPLTEKLTRVLQLIPHQKDFLPTTARFKHSTAALQVCARTMG